MDVIWESQMHSAKRGKKGGKKKMEEQYSFDRCKLRCSW